jgi:hypothetical protein
MANFLDIILGGFRLNSIDAAWCHHPESQCNQRDKKRTILGK